MVSVPEVLWLPLARLNYGGAKIRTNLLKFFQCIEYRCALLCRKLRQFNPGIWMNDHRPSRYIILVITMMQRFVLPTSWAYAYKDGSSSAINSPPITPD